MEKLKLTDERLFGVIKTFVALLIALFITFIALCFTSETPVQSFVTMLVAPLTKVRYFANVLEMSVPLIFCALACAILFRSGVFNLGVEGIFFISGIATTFAATQLPIASGFLHPIAVIALASLVGGLLMIIPGFLSARFNTNIVLSSLMLNSIYFGVGTWLLKRFMLASDISITASSLFAETAKLPYIIPGTRITIGFFLALSAVFAMHVMMNHTRLGYQIRITGLNPDFARYSGIRAFTLFLVIHFISGFLAGVGSSVELLSLYQRFTWAKVTAHGVTGMLISMMGNNKPVPVLIAALGISYLKIGAEIMSRSTVVPVEIISIVEATLVLLISSQYFLRGLREKRILKEGTANG